MEELRSTIRSHAEELEILGALKVSEELWPWRPSGHRYGATELLPGARDQARALVDAYLASAAA